MSRSDYRRIALELNRKIERMPITQATQAVIDKLLDALCIVFEGENESFLREKFLQACWEDCTRV